MCKITVVTSDKITVVTMAMVVTSRRRSSKSEAASPIVDYRRAMNTFDPGAVSAQTYPTAISAQVMDAAPTRALLPAALPLYPSARAAGGGGGHSLAPPEPGGAPRQMAAAEEEGPSTQVVDYSSDESAVGRQPAAPPPAGAVMDPADGDAISSLVGLSSAQPLPPSAALLAAPRSGARAAAAGASRPAARKRPAAAADLETEELLRWKADGQALLVQTGCASLGEVGLRFGAMRRAASSNAASDDADEPAAAPSAMSRVGVVWARLQNCRGQEKQKTDDIYMQCMGPRQKAADLKNPPGLSTVVMSRTDPTDACALPQPRAVRLYGQPRSKFGADPGHKDAELLFQAMVGDAATRGEIYEKSLRVGGLSAFMLPDGTLNLRLRRSTAGQSDGWLGPPQQTDKGVTGMPSRWVPTKWQQNRWKEEDKTADDNVRPFSVEIEFVSGDKVICETPFRIQSTGDAVMDSQKKKKKTRKGEQQPPQPRKRRSQLKTALPVDDTMSM